MIIKKRQKIIEDLTYVFVFGSVGLLAGEAFSEETSGPRKVERAGVEFFQDCFLAGVLCRLLQNLKKCGYSID